MITTIQSIRTMLGTIKGQLHGMRNQDIKEKDRLAIYNILHDVLREVVEIKGKL